MAQILGRFDDVLAQHHGIDVERLLGELSRLNGIMNIEAGVDADALQATLIERLAESGVDVDPEVLSALTEPLARIYAIPDHLHALAHMLGDGLVPSNAKDGYLARMLARRVLRMANELELGVTLADLMGHHLDHHLPNRSMKQTREGMLHILDLEEARYNEMMRKSDRLVRKALESTPQDATAVHDDLLFELLTCTACNPKSWSVLVARPVGNTLCFEPGSQLKWRSATPAWPRKRPLQPRTLPWWRTCPTSPRPRCSSTTMCTSRKWRQASLPRKPLPHEAVAGATHAVILDKTCFYPEGGGQEGDHGRLSTEATDRRVVDTRKQGEHVLHLVDGPMEVGDLVQGSSMPQGASN